MADRIERNLEIKATLIGSIEEAEEILRTLEAGAIAATNTADIFTRRVLYQTDSFFSTMDGSRLKLRKQVDVIREGEGTLSYVVLYHRSDEAVERVSEFVRYPVEDSDLFTSVFVKSGALKMIGCVMKTRVLWLFRNARIHLDKVVGLEGAFVEIEVVITNETERDASNALIVLLMNALGIKGEHMLAHSYLDMLSHRNAKIHCGVCNNITLSDESEKCNCCGVLLCTNCYREFAIAKDSSNMPEVHFSCKKCLKMCEVNEIGQCLLFR